MVSVLRFAKLPLPNYPVACTQWLAIIEHGRSVDLFQRSERPVKRFPMTPRLQGMKFLFCKAPQGIVGSDEDFAARDHHRCVGCLIQFIHCNFFELFRVGTKDGG